MGRGRQKAKHTKVARELKYFSPVTNYSDLERELASDTNYSDLERELGSESQRRSEEDPWAEYSDKYNQDEEDER